MIEWRRPSETKMIPKQLQQERGIGKGTQQNYRRKQQIDRVSCPEQEACIMPLSGISKVESDAENKLE